MVKRFVVYKHDNNEEVVTLIKVEDFISEIEAESFIKAALIEEPWNTYTIIAEYKDD